MAKTELLSPCGDYDCFLSAIRAGADAVYLGCDFSARAYAKNFTIEEVIRAIDHAHLFSRKVYLTLNTLLKNDEIPKAVALLAPLYEAGLDGVIVQDIGLISIIREKYPDLPIHASTQMTVTDTEGVKLLLDQGVSRVVLARELSLEEIKRIHSATGADLECFIHGALCYSYSGKCLMSSMIGGRSGNRGRCAQPCRLPYNDAYLLSPRDICTLTILPKLIDAGIASFKIEGRMKDPEYVAGVTGIYRKYMDLCLADEKKPYHVDPSDLELLQTLYTRSGHTEGYYEERNGRDMITISKPGYAKADEKRRKEVYERFCDKENTLAVSLSICLKHDQNAILSARNGQNEVTVTGTIVQRAQKSALGETDIRKQLQKTGGTEFKTTEIKIETDDAVFLPISALNALRRDALNALKADILSKYKRICRDGDRKQDPAPSAERKDEEKDIPKSCKLHVSVLTKEQALCALSMDRADIVSIPAEVLFSSEKELFEKNRSLGNNAKKLYMILPYICRDGYFKRNQEQLSSLLLSDEIEGVMIRNYESLHYLIHCHYQKEILADFHLYDWNRQAYDTLHELGVSYTTVPCELNKKELKERGIKGEDLIVYGRVPLMISAQCIQKTTKQCDHGNSMHELTDRYHVRFPAISNCAECYSVIYNSVPLSYHADADLLPALQPYAVRLLFTTEGPQMMEKITKELCDALFSDASTDCTYPYTRGHLLRGVE